MSGQRGLIQSHPSCSARVRRAHRIAAKRSVVHRPSALLRHGHEVRCQRWLLVLWPQCAAASATCGSSRAGAILWTAATMDGLPRRQWSFTPHQSSQLTTEGRTRKSERDTRRAVTTASHVLSSSGHAEALCALQVFWRETTHTSHASTLTQLVRVASPSPRHALSTATPYRCNTGLCTATKSTRATSSHIRARSRPPAQTRGSEGVQHGRVAALDTGAPGGKWGVPRAPYKGAPLRGRWLRGCPRPRATTWTPAWRSR